MKKWLSFEDCFDPARDPETFNDTELRAYASLAYLHPRQHPEGGFSLPDEISEEQFATYMHRLTVALCKLVPEYSDLSFEQREELVEQLQQVHGTVAHA